MKKIAYMGLFGAVAIIFGYVESLFPVFAGIPGIKMGLTNLVTVFILYTYSYREAALVSLIRILVIGFLFGNLFSILLSLKIDVNVNTILFSKVQLEHFIFSTGSGAISIKK